MEKISVVIPAFNSEATVARAVESVYAQDYENKEVIVIDDGSSDGTGEVLSELKEIHPDLIVITKENGGVSAARNDGIKAASGKWLMTLDADDYIDPEALKWMELRTHDGACDLIMCGMKLVYCDRSEFFRPEEEMLDDRSEFLSAMMPWLYDNHLLTTHSNKLYDLDIIRREEIYYDPSLQINEDIDFVFRYLKCAGSIGIIKGAYLNYVQHGVGESLVTTFQKYGVTSSLKILRDFNALCDVTDFSEKTLRGMKHRLLVHILSFVGIMYYRSSMSDEEITDAIRDLLADEDFRRLMAGVRPRDLKTAAALVLLRGGHVKTYHMLCRFLYRT